MKICSSDELKVVFYSIWNLAFEAKCRDLVRESQAMLATLYDQVKLFAQYCHEQRMRGDSASALSGFSEKDNSATVEISEELVRTIVYRTLSLTAELHVHVKNY